MRDDAHLEKIKTLKEAGARFFLENPEANETIGAVKTLSSKNNFHTI